MRRLSFRSRLSLWHTAAVAAFLGAGAFAGHWALTRFVLGQLDAALVALAETEASAVESDVTHPAHVHEFAAGTAPPSFVRLDRFVQIVDLDGNVVAKSANLGTARLPAPPAMLERLKTGEVVFDTFEDFGEEPIRVAALSANGPHGTRYGVEVAGSLDDAYGVLTAGRWLLLGLSLVLLAGVAVTAAVFARRALRPVDQIVAQARRIGESNLSERLPQPASRDELRRLVDTLNAMLDRVEHGVETQRRFTADASHELRSPLSRLRAEIEVTLRRTRDAAEYEETLRSCLDEVHRLSQLTEELLTLARLDAAEAPVGERPAAPLLPIVADAVRRLASQGERAAVKVRVDPAASPAVRAGSTAVGLALANILDNAVKFSSAGTAVTVEVSTDGPDALVVVNDDGPGVAPDELPRLFDRFHRGRAARESEAPGFGLGLAISRALIEREGGRISVENGRGGGARFSIRLPLAG
jgi:two-component system OmpR family sensor kinase